MTRSYENNFEYVRAKCHRDDFERVATSMFGARQTALARYSCSAETSILHWLTCAADVALDFAPGDLIQFRKDGEAPLKYGIVSSIEPRNNILTHLLVKTVGDFGNVTDIYVDVVRDLAQKADIPKDILTLSKKMQSKNTEKD